MKFQNGARRTARRALAFAIACGLAFSTTACDKKALRRALRPAQAREEARDKSALSVDQLEQAIAGYASDSERRKLGEAAELGVEAAKNLGSYRLELAQRFIEMKMFKDAYDVLVLVSESYPEDSRVYYNAGMSAAHFSKSFEIKGKAGAKERERWLEIAESCYKRSLSIAPRSVQTLYGTAVLYAFELGKPEEAAGHLVNLLGIETKNVDAMMLLARCFVELGKLEEAANWYETAAKTTVVPEKKRAAEENRARVLERLGGSKDGR